MKVQRTKTVTHTNQVPHSDSSELKKVILASQKVKVKCGSEISIKSMI